MSSLDLSKDIGPVIRRSRTTWTSRAVDCGDVTFLIVENMLTDKRALFRTDPGMASRLDSFHWSLDGKGYAQARYFGGVARLHNVVLDRTPEMALVIDHVDGDVRNNRTANLAVVTTRENVAKKFDATWCVRRHYGGWRVAVEPRDAGCPTVHGSGRKSYVMARRIARILIAAEIAGWSLDRYSVRDGILEMEEDR